MSVEIGKRLKQARETLGLSLADIEAQTRIHKKYLEAIENGQFDLLPGPIYVRSYIRSYANVVGENPQVLLKLYQSPIGSHRSTEHFSKMGRVGMRTPMSLPQGEEPKDKTDALRSSVPLSRTSRYPAMNQRQMDSSDENVVSYHRNTGMRNARSENLSEHHSQNRIRSHSIHQDEQETFDQEMTHGATHHTSIRRPVMPSDVPKPEELGIQAEEREPKLQEKRSLASRDVQSALASQSNDDIPVSLSRRRDRKKEKEKKFTFGRMYTLLLIIGAIALVIATLVFMWYRAENANQKRLQPVVQQQTSPEQEKTKGEPRLHVINTSPTGMDRYELVNAEALELSITWLNGGDSPFEIRDQEVGEPIDTGKLTNSNKQFNKKFNTSIWLKLFKPNQVNVKVNGQDIRTDIYKNEKVIHISLLN